MANPAPSPIDWLRTYSRVAPVTALIVAVSTGVWLVTAMQSKFSGNFYDSSWALASTLWGPWLSQGGTDLFRPLLTIFMHLDFGHLIINMFMLVLIGREVERYLGSGLYALAYITGGMGASAAVVLMDFQAPTVGASGAIFSLMVLLVEIHRRAGLGMTAPLVLIAVNVGYSFLGSGVSLWGHLGGLITGGFLWFFLFRPNPSLRWGGCAAVLGASVVSTLLSAGLWG